MNLQIERTHIEEMIKEFPELSEYQDQLKLGNRVEVPFYQLSSIHLGFLHGLYLSAGPSMAGKAAQLATLQEALEWSTNLWQPS